MTGFNVPFLPDPGYAGFLARLGGRLQAVHYSLFDQTLQDARIKIDAVPVASIIDLLTQLKSPKKYLLANGRLHPADLYTNKEPLFRLIDKLEKLLTADVIDGIVFADSYMLAALGEAAPTLARCLEAIPSINFMITCVEQLDILLEIVVNAGFSPPGKVTLDRSLNRSSSRLGDTAGEIKKRYPAMLVEVLANEGCLNHCPFRATHEALIGSANVFADAGYDTLQLNKNLACIRLLLENPHRILASPFIRPEDTRFLPKEIDVIKLCGRTLGAAFLERCVEAYVNGNYSGNLFELLDAANWMTNHWLLANASLPANFYAGMNACDKVCSRCLFCKQLFSVSVSPLPFSLQNLNS